jgi:hypothetical protein
MVKTANKNKQPYRLINKIKKREKMKKNNNSFKRGKNKKKKIMEIVYFVSYQIAKFLTSIMINHFME